jgi:hypothetical protein
MSEEANQEISQVKVDLDEKLLDQAVNRLRSFSLYSESGSEYTKDTFNPSTLFNDKTQAEWFGNVVKNRESDALKAIVQSAQKPSKMLYVMIGLVGFLGGIMIVGLFSGSGGIHLGGGGSGPNTTHTTYLPPPPPPSSTGGAILNKVASLALFVIQMVT